MDACLRRLRYDDYPRSPGTPRDPQGWERFWTELVKAEAKPGCEQREAVQSASRAVGRLRLGWGDERCRTHFGLFSDLGLGRVWFLANGISMLPDLAAYCGFGALAVDVSPTAMEYCAAEAGVDERSLRRFFATFRSTGPGRESVLDAGATQEAYTLAYVPGGSVSYKVADLFSWRPEPQSAEAVVVQSFADLCQPSDLRELLARLYSWLRPGGVVTMDGDSCNPFFMDSPPVAAFAAALESQGFQIYLKAAYEWQCREQRRGWLSRARSWGVRRDDQRTGREEALMAMRAEQHEVAVQAVRSGRKLAVIEGSRP